MVWGGLFGLTYGYSEIQEWFVHPVVQDKPAGSEGLPEYPGPGHVWGVLHHQYDQMAEGIRRALAIKPQPASPVVDGPAGIPDTQRINYTQVVGHRLNCSTLITQIFAITCVAAGTRFKRS